MWLAYLGMPIAKKQASTIPPMLAVVVSSQQYQTYSFYVRPLFEPGGEIYLSE